MGQLEDLQIEFAAMKAAQAKQAEDIVKLTKERDEAQIANSKLINMIPATKENEEESQDVTEEEPDTLIKMIDESLGRVKPKKNKER
jgi:hypothetical protein